MADVAEENARLKEQLAQLQKQREKERNEYEAKVANERSAARAQADAAQERTAELDAMRASVVKLTRQLDEEVTRRDQVMAETQLLERKLQDLSDGTAPLGSPGGRGGGGARARVAAPDDDDRASQVSTKLMRVVDQWMRQRDLQQALLRGSSINDSAFTTLSQALGDCPSLQTLDLSLNFLTMDSCADLCQLITSAPHLSFVSLADNLLSMRSLGYFMTAIMERQNTKKHMPLDLLDLTGNEGLLAAAQAPVPGNLLRQVHDALSRSGCALPPGGPELVAQVMRSLWRFMHDTGHPQVKNTNPEEVSFSVMDRVTLRKMETALSKIMLMSVESSREASSLRPVTANLALLSSLESGGASEAHEQSRSVAVPRTSKESNASATPAGAHSAYAKPPPRELTVIQDEFGRTTSQQQHTRSERLDPFADLKAAFKPPREKLKTFNLRQIITRSGTVLMNMLERLLETTEIDAVDVETDQTLLEYACNTGNMQLAKLCYRRGANLCAKTKKEGDTPFNIVTKSRRYDMMEFLHLYGVPVNSGDAKGRTALHCAAENDDVDGICRLVEWGADVNIRDNSLRTPIHIAAEKGNMKATMLLLEVGADMNAKDNKLYTAAAHANFNSHFALFDRLVSLGGQRHGQIAVERSASQKRIGDLVVSAGMLKSSSLGRIGKITVAGMPPPLKAKGADEKKK